MFEHGSASKVAAVATIIALQLIAIPSLAQSGAVLDGTVLRADRATPIAGAKIHLANARTGELVGSAPTADDGSFHLDSIPGGEYDIAVPPVVLQLLGGHGGSSWAEPVRFSRIGSRVKPPIE